MNERVQPINQELFIKFFPTSGEVCQYIGPTSDIWAKSTSTQPLVTHQMVVAAFAKLSEPSLDEQDYCTAFPGLLQFLLNTTTETPNSKNPLAKKRVRESIRTQIENFEQEPDVEKARRMLRGHVSSLVESKHLTMFADATRIDETNGNTVRLSPIQRVRLFESKVEAIMRNSSI